MKSNTLHTFEFPSPSEDCILWKVGRTVTDAKLTEIENNSLPFLEFCTIVPQDDAIAFLTIYL